ncbi:hypothetical protein MJ863_16955 [Alcaligenes ammonioxydans]|uniref:hypothetical protein n=1 Tax=Alcaligenes ammonioxydans TaxID=2582914 RepID=UPI001F065B84|nr:hypothetical protein [Alcaligenes ammonioxydans]MCH1881278.1 hypothetical protein [Alcaligenes ammonioxydans]
MKAHLDGDKLLLIAETQEERAALHEFKFRGGIKAMQLHRCTELNSELELTMHQSPFATHDPSPAEVVGSREALKELREALQRCSDLAHRFLD